MGDDASVFLRQMTASDGSAAAAFLDRRTCVLRWLVAFLRHQDRQPLEAREDWSLWRDATPAAEEPRLVAAHCFATATTYVQVNVGAGDGAGAACAALAELLEEELLPERLVGDREVVEALTARAPGILERAVATRGIDVLVADGAAGQRHEGFRPARRGDLPLLEEYARLLGVESGEELPQDLEALVEHELLFVVEDAGRVAGHVRSNFSDGRFVHAGGLYVHPAWRGRRLGRALAEGLASHVRESQGARVVLDAYQDNVAALRSYRAAGYERVGEGLELRYAGDAWGRGL